MTKTQLKRRELLQLLALGGIATPFVGGLPFGRVISPRAAAQNASPHRLLQIFLLGGWDAPWTTDPALGGKANATNYAREYWDAAVRPGPVAQTVGGVNPNLQVGFGLTDAIPAFQALPTAFCNGMYVEVTAHELAVNYMYSGKLSLSRSKEFASFIAKMADKNGGFPAHVVLGSGIPLADTKYTNPPLQAVDMNLFSMMLAGPKHEDYVGDIVLNDSTIAEAHTLLNTLNNGFKSGKTKQTTDSLVSWDNAEAGLAPFYAANYQDQIDISTVQGDYNYAGTGSTEAKFAGAFLCLKSAISPFVTINFGNYDTHQNHVATQLPSLQSFSRSLNQLVADLAATPDTHPHAGSGDTLADNTTILITSEFNRTPLFNQAGGTDHWKTGTAILMGRGVIADTVVGSTNDAGHALNLAGSAQINSSSDPDVFLPDHLAAAILRHMGFNEEADELTGVDISGQLFNS